MKNILTTVLVLNVCLISPICSYFLFSGGERVEFIYKDKILENLVHSLSFEIKKCVIFWLWLIDKG